MSFRRMATQESASSAPRKNQRSRLGSTSHPPHSPNAANYHFFPQLWNIFFVEKIFLTAIVIEIALKEYFASKSPSFYKKEIESLLEE